MEDNSKKSLNCLLVGNTDLFGNKFNGYDLQIYLNQKGINANCLVKYKKSHSKNVFILNGNYSKAILKSDLFANADIIHLNLIHATDFDIMYLPVYAALKPLVITLHDAFFTTGHCVHSFGCEKWKTACKNCNKLDIEIKSNIDTTSFDFKLKKDAVQNSNICAIVASDYMENLIKQSPVWANKKIYKVPFGINQEIFKPVEKSKAKRKLNISNDSIVIMLRAVQNEFKGINLIKEALRNIKTNRKITIITVEQKGLFNEFKDRFEIKDYGWIYDDKKLSELYQAADLFLMPSEQEAFGMMAIEAMSSGVPVLSIKGTSLESVTNAPECGVCCKKEEFANELNNLINNEQELKIRAEKSLKFAKDNYGKEIYIKRMLEVYEDIIKNHKIDAEWQGVLEQMKKYNIRNYHSETRVEFADNAGWKILYRSIIRPVLKLIYGKKKVKSKYDKRFL